MTQNAVKFKTILGVHMEEVSATELRRLYEAEGHPISVVMERLNIPNAPALYKLLRDAEIPLRQRHPRAEHRRLRLVD